PRPPGMGPMEGTRPLPLAVTDRPAAPPLPTAGRQPARAGLTVAVLCVPGLVAAVQVGGVDQAEVLERGGGQARGVALVAHDDDRALVVERFLQPAGAGGIEPPLANVA